jgi:PAS domain S-box-containing protein
VTFVNRAWLEFTGCELLEALGDGWVEYVHPAFRAAMADSTWQALTAREEMAVEVPLRRHDGLYRRMLVKSAPRFDQEAGFSGLVACMIDVGDLAW